MVRFAPDPAPAKRLRASLEQARREGVPFGTAWAFAFCDALEDLRRAERVSWSTVFTAMRDIWSAAYDRRPLGHALFVAEDAAA